MWQGRNVDISEHPFINHGHSPASPIKASTQSLVNNIKEVLLDVKDAPLHFRLRATHNLSHVVVPCRRCLDTLLNTGHHGELRYKADGRGSRVSQQKRLLHILHLFAVAFQDILGMRLLDLHFAASLRVWHNPNELRFG